MILLNFEYRCWPVSALFPPPPRPGLGQNVAMARPPRPGQAPAPGEAEKNPKTTKHDFQIKYWEERKRCWHPGGWQAFGFDSFSRCLLLRLARSHRSVLPTPGCRPEVRSSQTRPDLQCRQSPRGNPSGVRGGPRQFGRASEETHQQKTKRRFPRKTKRAKKNGKSGTSVFSEK